jgi:hypothetical protein
MRENSCPVCGFEMEAPPKDYRICPSCGTEFGVHDVNATIADLREAWMNTGPKWWSRADVQPVDWDPIAQMEKAGIVIKRPAASEPAISTATGSITVSGPDWAGWHLHGGNPVINHA